MKYITGLLLGWLSLASFPAFGTLAVPKLESHVNDYARMLNSNEQKILEAKLRAYEDTTSSQIVILTIASLEGETIEEFSMRVVEEWKLGRKGKDNGVLITASKEDRKMRIEVGYGFEGVFPDATCKHIIDQVITPQFKQSNYASGFTKGVDALMLAAKGEYKADGGESDLSGSAIAFLFISFIVCIVGAVVCSKNLAAGASVGGFGSLVVGVLLLSWLTIGWGVLITIIGALASLFLYAGVGEDGDGFLVAMASGDGGGGSWGGGGGGFGGGGASGGW